jgi:hypothetical protein
MTRLFDSSKDLDDVARGAKYVGAMNDIPPVNTSTGVILAAQKGRREP